MTQAHKQEDKLISAQEKTIRAKVFGALAGLLVIMGLGLVAVVWFADTEKQRDLQILQSRLSVIADSRAQAVQTWLAQQYDVLNGLARNEALQIYVSVLQMDEQGRSPDEALAHAAYLRTLLQATAARSGFEAERTNDLPANVSVESTGGLALLTPDGAMIAATPGLPPLEGRLRTDLDNQPITDRGLLGIHHAVTGALRIGFVVPVVTPTGPDLTPTVIARVVGLRPLGKAFWETLVQPGETAETVETHLIRRDGNGIRYLTALRDGSAPLDKVLAINTETLIDAEALTNPGRVHAGRDYAAKPAIAVSRAIPGTDWVLVTQIGRAEALAQSTRRRVTLITILVLAVVLVDVTLVAVWRSGTSVRAQAAALRFQAAAQRFEALSAFLDVVTDSQPQPVFVTDPDNVLTFGNQKAASVMGVPKAELPGRPLFAMLGHDRGGIYATVNRDVLETGRIRCETHVFQDESGQDIVWQSYHCPLTLGPSRTPAVLTSIEDLTALVRERTRREQTTRQLIETLVGLVDERDPDSADQSRHVSVVARTIAEEMGLDDTLIAATDQAAALVNIGKIRVPRTLLTKQGPLTDDEVQRVREAMDSGPDILAGIAFDAPVLETLRQINERVDGGGRPHGLKGDEILPSAQAVALANTFVALISPRAFREGRSFDKAEEIVLGEVGKRFGRRPVLSLLNFLNNKGGRDAWRSMATKT